MFDSGAITGRRRLMNLMLDTPRLLNRFSLGADPEFIFTDPLKNSYIYAEDIGGFNTLEAFGCDMAGRQAEIRAYPSRFALEVVASVCDSLRWMSYKGGPPVYTLNWRAMAWNGKDGCGGHIHLGRKTPHRAKDVEILDTVTLALLNANILNKGLNEFRVSNTNFGKSGDYRLQPHGYEYRALPTSLSSPFLMYFVLVVNKLAVLERYSFCTSNILEQVFNLLNAHAKADYDAAILLKALERYGPPQDDQSDFKARWGIAQGPEERERAFYPSVISPERKTCEELFEHFVHGVNLPAHVPNPTWKPFVLPKAFNTVFIQPHTLGHLPDIGANLVSKSHKVSVRVGNYFAITGKGLPFSKIKEAFRKEGTQYSPLFLLSGNSKAIDIEITRDMCKSQMDCRAVKRVLTNFDLFPVCKADLIRKVDWDKWAVQTPTKQKYIGKVIVEKNAGQVVAETPVPSKFELTDDLGEGGDF